MNDCPLCSSKVFQTLQVQGPDELYHQCQNCRLLYQVSPAPLSDEQAHARYSLHQNGCHGHMQFLKPVVDLLSQEPRQKKVLDWGSGPTPTLANQLNLLGFSTYSYDLFFQPSKPLGSVFDLMTSTEVVEHFVYPHKDWQEMLQFLAPHGKLVVMTQLTDRLDEQDNLTMALQNWSYRRDSTHRSFYHSQTMAWIAAHFGLQSRLTVVNPTLGKSILYHF